ncbi:MAG: hypothetical protein JST14_14615 [Bacteroidetes bacterium]|nr:hypothetical protein [Bacteroidota bacterium]MBS1977298.1 hypothetical protein [Bacteroidota bacterium]
MKKVFFWTIVLFLGLAVKGYSQTVYASEKGEKYHTADCKMSGDAKDMTLAAAKKAGKTPCGVCKPEEHFKDKTAQCTGKTSDGTRCKRMTSNKKGKCYQHQGS